MDDGNKRILLVRHGETEWNRTHRFQGRSDTPLNENGIRQAKAMAVMLKDESLTTVYASPLCRALETARLIKVYHPLPLLIEEEGFIEMDLGEFDGMASKEWATQYPDFMKSWWEDPGKLKMPGGECLEQVQDRALHALDRIIASHPENSTILVCSHNFVILSLLCHAKKMSLNGFRELRQANGAVSIIHVNKGHMDVVVLNRRPDI
jgi:phosphoserine phosphatase